MIPVTVTLTLMLLKLSAPCVPRDCRHMGSLAGFHHTGRNQPNENMHANQGAFGLRRKTCLFYLPVSSGEGWGV